MSSITGVEGKTPPSFPERPRHIERLQQTLNTHFNHIPARTPAGCNLVVLQQGTVVDKPLVLHSSNIQENAAQHWGSVSKQFTAACVAQLVEQGLLNWEDDIRTHLPELPSFSYNDHPEILTVDHLLQMRSGLPETTVLCLMVGADDETMSIPDKIALIQKMPELKFPPGSQNFYCNTNYYLLAALVERVSGKPFIDYVRENLFVPLGMGCRCVADPTAVPSIDSYTADRFERVPTVYNTWGAGGIVGHPTDVLGWNAALNRGEFSSLLMLPTGSRQEPGVPEYARGLNIAEQADYRFIFHSGAVAAFVTQFVRFEHKRDPEKTFAFFLTMNVDDIPTAAAIVAEVSEILAREKVVLHLPGPAPESSSFPLISQELALSFAGTYFFAPFGTSYIFTPVQEKGTWALQWNLVKEGETRPITTFLPFVDDQGITTFRSPIGDILELTPLKDIAFHAAKIAPFLLRRNPS